MDETITHLGWTTFIFQKYISKEKGYVAVFMLDIVKDLTVWKSSNCRWRAFLSLVQTGEKSLSCRNFHSFSSLVWYIHFRQRYRSRRNSIGLICNVDLETPTKRNHALSVGTQVLASLRFLASVACFNRKKEGLYQISVHNAQIKKSFLKWVDSLHAFLPSMVFTCGVVLGDSHWRHLRITR